MDIARFLATIALGWAPVLGGIVLSPSGAPVTFGKAFAIKEEANSSSNSGGRSSGNSNGKSSTNSSEGGCKYSPSQGDESPRTAFNLVRKLSFVHELETD
jgi:hypothetical protein